MPSTKKAGDNAENRAVVILNSLGYLTDKAHRTMKPVFTKQGLRYFSQANDYFGMFDIIAKKASKTIWVQVKSNVNHTYGIKNELEEFWNKYCGNDEVVEIWLKVRYKGYVIFSYGFNNTWTKRYINLKGTNIEPYPYSN